ncbi:MAG: RING finger protein [Candidatus Hodarchaeota archaeon]
MKNRNEVFQLTSEAKKLLKEYLAEIQSNLAVGHASPTEGREITEEVREHILQAYWKETGSKSVKMEPLHEVLNVMGDPHEVASEYLIDRRETPPTRILSSKKTRSSSLLLTSLEAYVPKQATFLYLAAPLLIVIGIYILLLDQFPRLRDLWLVLLVLGDIVLLIPLIWYQFGWKATEDLSKWRVLTPRKIRTYLFVGFVLLLLGGVILPWPHGKMYSSDPDDYQDDRNLIGHETLTLDGNWVHDEDNDPEYYFEYYIDLRFIILANLMQFCLAILFLIAGSKAPDRWKEANVQITLLDVEPPVQVDDNGFIRVQTMNCSQRSFPNAQMEILGHSPELELAIKPSAPMTFEPNEIINWFIWLTPRIAGKLNFGNIVLQLDEKLAIVSPSYYFNIKGRTILSEYQGTPRSGIVAPKSVSSRENDDNDLKSLPNLLTSCGICKQPYNPSDLVEFCASCGSLFHLEHLQEWLKGHENCPNCARKVQFSDLGKSYSFMVLQRLKQLENESQRLRTLFERFEEPPKEIIDN